MIKEHKYVYIIMYPFKYTPTKPAHITPQPRLQNLETTYNKPIKETSLN